MTKKPLFSLHRLMGMIKKYHFLYIALWQCQTKCHFLYIALSDIINQKQKFTANISKMALFWTINNLYGGDNG